MGDRIDTSTRRAMPLLWLLAAAVVWILSRPATPAPVVDVDAVVYATSTAFRPTLSLAAILGFGAVFYGLAALNGVWYRTWIAYAQLALWAGGALLILAPGVALRTTHAVPADPVAAFRLWNQVSAVGYAMIPAGLVVGVLLAIDSRANRPKRARRSA